MEVARLPERPFFISMRSAQNANNSMTGLFSTIGFMVLYVSLVMMVMHKCFAMSHVIPDRVLRWIGGGDQLGETGADEQSKTMVIGAMKNTTTVMQGVGLGNSGKDAAAGIDGAIPGAADKLGGGGPGGPGGTKPSTGALADAHLGQNTSPNMGNEVAAAQSPVRDAAVGQTQEPGVSDKPAKV